MDSPAFPNYQQLENRLPRAFWWVLRVLTLALVLTVIYLLLFVPEIGLVLTWQLLIPLLPLSFAVFPGVWRNICPMALLNQLPRTFGFSREKTLSDNMRRTALYVSILGFVLFVLMRHPLLNQNGVVLGVIFALALLLAFLGGFVFKGRSGWCGTFCPLAPIQKAYGHAPLLLVKNGYCESCLGCQKNCYDFNPRAALFSDLDDTDTWWSEQRRFFLALLPGLIFGFFNAGDAIEAGTFVYLQEMATYLLISLGGFYLLHSSLHIDYFRLSSAYSLTALSMFYWYGFPVVASGVHQLFAVTVPEPAIQVLRITVVVVSLLVFLRAQLSWHHHRQSQQNSSTATLGKNVKNLKDALEQTGKMAQVHEQASNRKFLVMPGQSLLDALQANELPIMSGCRMGMCGSDPIVVTDGMENLPPPEDHELNTLKRLGLVGKARLACCCKPQAGISIDLAMDPAQADVTKVPGLQETIQTSAAMKVIIIGNGIAGISCAERLREVDENVQIILITREPYHFYNRMGLEAVLHGKSGLQDLYLMKEEWYQRNRIDFWLNTQVNEIIPELHQVVLGTNKILEYDKLVLASGAKAFVPEQPGFQSPGVFTLRNADDALHIRAYIQQKGCRRVLVLGGGVLGVEAADALLQMGIRVTLVHTGVMLMDRQLDVHAAVLLENFLRNKGVKVMTGTSINSINPVDDLLRVVLANGKQVITDMVLLCIGIRANTELASIAGLEVNRGVVVNSQMRTSNPDIYCIGDAAELPGAMGGLWSVGSEQGKVAADAILGEEAAYEGQVPPPVQLKVSGIDLKSFGSLAVDETVQSYTEGDNQSQQWRHLRIRDGQVVAGVFVNSMQAANAAITASKQRNSPLSRRDVMEILKKDTSQKN